MFKKRILLGTIALLSMGGTVQTGAAGRMEVAPTVQRTMRAVGGFPEVGESEKRGEVVIEDVFAFESTMLSWKPTAIENELATGNLSGFFSSAVGQAHEGVAHTYFYVSIQDNAGNPIDRPLAELWLETQRETIERNFEHGAGIDDVSFATEGDCAGLVFNCADIDTGMEALEFFETILGGEEGVFDMSAASSAGSGINLGRLDGGSLRFIVFSAESVVQDGETAEVYVNVDDPLTIDQILANVSAEDLLGESVEVECTAEEKAKYRKETIGTYKVTVTATDKYGQTATCYLNIHVVDTVGPTITLKKNLEFASGDTLAISAIGDYVEVADNGTEHGGTIGDPAYTIDGQPFTGDRTWGPSDVGTHTLKVTVADSSGNTTTKEFSIVVRDTQAPVITMKDGAEGKLLIGLSRVLSFKESDFLALFQATDNVTPSDEIVLDVEGSFIPSKVGSYDIVVTAKDKANNVGRYTCKVTVDADFPPVFILSDALVGATAENPLSSSQIQTIVQNAIYAGRTVTSVLIDDSEYQANATKEGSYPVTYSAQVANADGSVVTETGSLTVRVSGKSAEEEPSNWELFCRWWTDGWQCFCNWFRGVFTKFEWDCWITDEQWDERFPESPTEK